MLINISFNAEIGFSADQQIKITKEDITKEIIKDAMVNDNFLTTINIDSENPESNKVMILSKVNRSGIMVPTLIEIGYVVNQEIHHDSAFTDFELN